MKTAFSKLLLMALVCFCAYPSAHAGKKVSGKYKQAAKYYKFDIQARAKFTHGIKGTVIPVSEVEQELNRFFEALDELGVAFVKKAV